MARGAWDPTAWTLAAMAEQWRDGDSRAEPYMPGDFHPFRVQDDSSATDSGVLPYDPEFLQQFADGVTVKVR